MCVCVSQNSRDSQSWKLSKLSSCEIYKCLRKRNKNHVPFLRQSQDQRRKGRKHLAVKRQQTSLWATKVLSSTKTNGCKKSKNMNGNWIWVKSIQISPASLLTWTEFRDKMFLLLCNLELFLISQKPSVCIVADVRQWRTVSCCYRLLSCLWHLYKPSYN